MFTSASSQSYGHHIAISLWGYYEALWHSLSIYSTLSPVTGTPSIPRAPKHQYVLRRRKASCDYFPTWKIERVSPITGSVCQHPAPSWSGEYEINRCDFFNLHQPTVRWQRHHGSLELKHGTLMAWADSGKQRFRLPVHTRSTQQLLKLLRDRLHQKPAKCNSHVQAFLWKSLLSKILPYSFLKTLTR